MGGVSVEADDPTKPDILAMIRESDAYYADLYPIEHNYLASPEVLSEPGAVFLAARSGGALVGMGALVPDARGYAEIKRMFVASHARGLGVGRAILVALEAAAHDRGIDLLRLETGIHQHAAHGLYRSAGFAEIGPFGDYPDDSLSIFLEKRLDQGAAG